MTTSRRGLRRKVAVVLAVAAIGLTACSSGDDSGAKSGSGSQQTASPTIATADGSKLGTVLVDPRGYTLYLLAPEKGGKIKCTEKCLEFWPPLMATGGAAPVGGEGIDASQVGTIARPDGGNQVTYNDYPLYFFSGDKAPGDTNGQGVEKVWFAMTPDGTAAS